MDEFTRAANENAARALMRAGNHRGAEQRLRQMLAENPADARVMALLAHCRDEDGKRKPADVLKLARDAAAIDPDDHLVRSTLSWALLVHGKGKASKKEATQITEDIAAEDPTDSTALYNLAVAWQRSEKNKVVGAISAKMMFDDAERFASTVEELLTIAHLRLHAWNHASAASLAQRAMELDPTQPDIFRILAECELASKRPLEAYDLALEALRLRPGDKAVMRLLTRARSRSNPLLRPFLPGVDWIVEMDRRGLVIVPLLMLVLGGSLFVSVGYDLGRMEEGEAPAIVVSLALGAAFAFAVVSYLTAIGARARIRRDLRRIALPKF